MQPQPRSTTAAPRCQLWAPMRKQEAAGQAAQHHQSLPTAQSSREAASVPGAARQVTQRHQGTSTSRQQRGLGCRSLATAASRYQPSTQPRQRPQHQQTARRCLQQTFPAPRCHQAWASSQACQTHATGSSTQARSPLCPARTQPLCAARHCHLAWMQFHQAWTAGGALQRVRPGGPQNLAAIATAG
jgi:hypothetical protein